MADTEHTLTLVVPERIAKALDSSDAAGLRLEADSYAVLQVVRWNIEQVARELGEEVEDEVPSCARLVELADRVKVLAAAYERLGRGERPAQFHRLEEVT